MGTIGPLVPKLGVIFHENGMLSIRPRVLVDVRVQVIVPSLTALLARPPGEVFRALGPLLVAKVLDVLHHQTVLLVGPGGLLMVSWD